MKRLCKIALLACLTLAQACTELQVDAVLARVCLPSDGVERRAWLERRLQQERDFTIRSNQEVVGIVE